MTRPDIARFACLLLVVVASNAAFSQGFSSASSTQPQPVVPAATSPLTGQAPAPASASTAAAVGPAAVQPAPAAVSPRPFSSMPNPVPGAAPLAVAPVPAGASPPTAVTALAPAAAAMVTPSATTPFATAPFGSGPTAQAGRASGGGFEPADRVVVKKRDRRMYLMRADRIVAEYPIRLGLNPYGHKEREGDFKTPEGVYRLVRRNPRSEFFLSLEVSYPNESDLERARRLGVKPGGLIMIHGQPNVPRKTPDYYARNDWTDGCIAVSNSDMVDIWLRTGLGTLVEIRP